MKLIRKARLYYREGRSNKIHELDLRDLGSRAGSDRYLVDFRYGRRGRALREGTKTEQPVDLATANEIFDSVVVSKTNKGYLEAEPTTPAAGAGPASAQGDDLGAREQAILGRIAAPGRGGSNANALKRAVWRAGELGLQQAAVPMMQHIGSADALLDYCIAWSLGRCGDPGALPALRRRIGDSTAPQRVW